MVIYRDTRRQLEELLESLDWSSSMMERSPTGPRLVSRLGRLEKARVLRSSKYYSIPAVRAYAPDVGAFNLGLVDTT